VYCDLWQDLLNSLGAASGPCTRSQLTEISVCFLAMTWSNRGMPLPCNKWSVHCRSGTSYQGPSNRGYCSRKYCFIYCPVEAENVCVFTIILPDTQAFYSSAFFVLSGWWGKLDLGLYYRSCLVKLLCTCFCVSLKGLSSEVESALSLSALYRVHA